MQIALEALGPTLKQRFISLFSDSSTTVAVLQKLYTKSVSLRAILGRIIVLLQKYNVTLDVHHIMGELNTLADILSRTVERNRYMFDQVALSQCKKTFDFDLFGSSLNSLAPSYPTASVYRHRSLLELPASPLLSIVIPPWPRVLLLLSELAADGPKIKGQALIVLPHWPAQPWWPLAVHLSGGMFLKF